MTPALSKAWHRFWFSRTRRHPLGIMRLILGFWCIYRYIPLAYEYVSNDATLDPALYHWVLDSKVLTFPYPPTGATLDILSICMVVVGLMAALGLFTRITCALFSLSFIYLFSGFTSHDFFNHEQILTFQVLLILAFCPGSTAWSLDRLIAIRRFERQRKRRQAKPLQPASRRRLMRHLQGPSVPRWGLQLVLVLLAVVYTTAGLSKVRYSGGQWHDGQTLRYYLDGTHANEQQIAKQVFFGDADLASQYEWKDNAALADHAYGLKARRVLRENLTRPTIFPALAWMTLLVELSGLVILIGPRVRNLYLISAFGMHTGIGMWMELYFNDYRILILILISYPVLLSQARWARQKLSLGGRKSEA